MGLFQNKKSDKQPPIDETSDGVQRFFDGYFKDLQARGSEHFDKVIDEKTKQFKQDLDATVAKADTELKRYLSQRIDELFIENNKTMKEAQDAATQALNQSIEAFQEQYEQLNASLQKVVTHQQAILTKVFEETNSGIVEMKKAEDTALKSISSSVQELEQQQRQLGEMLQNNLADQQAVLVSAFQENMAQIIEHYLLEAVGDQYDMKAQLPSIIKQMEANKQTIADDMKL